MDKNRFNNFTFIPAQQHTKRAKSYFPQQIFPIVCGDDDGDDTFPFHLPVGAACEKLLPSNPLTKFVDLCH